MTKDAVKIRPGQIWRENDSRFVRYILILRVTEHGCYFRTCDFDGLFKSGTRESRANRSRFDKGAYRFVRETA